MNGVGAALLPLLVAVRWSHLGLHKLHYVTAYEIAGLLGETSLALSYCFLNQDVQPASGLTLHTVNHSTGLNGSVVSCERLWPSAR